MITVVIGGDVCPSGSNLPCFLRGDGAAVFHDLMPEFLDADLAIVNLECPLVDQDSPITKCGPNFRAPSAAIEALRCAGIDVLNLANNHILDHGAAGLESTARAAAAAGIAVVGAGRNRQEARRILIRSLGELRVGILGVAEREFSVATDSSPGANPLDLIDLMRNLADHRERFDYLIVLVHGGNEYYPFPSPRLRDTCRFLVEQGASAVICQHSHWAGCWEEYRGGHIVYGQGVLIGDTPGLSAGLRRGVVVRLRVSYDRTARMELLPFEQSRSGPGARKMKPEDVQDLLQSMAERSGQLQTHGFLEEQWREFCRERRHSYQSTVLGHGRILRRLNRNGLLVKLLYSRASQLALTNLIRCESHREVLETVLDETGRNLER